MDVRTYARMHASTGLICKADDCTVLQCNATQFILDLQTSMALPESRAGVDTQGA